MATRIALAAIVAPASSGAAGTRCWIDHGALVAPAAFGDIAGDFLIDLAAPVSQIDAGRAAADGQEADRPVGALYLAGVHLSGARFQSAELDARTRGFDTVINGVIGADILSHYVVEITPSPCRLRLLRGAGVRASKRVTRLKVRIVEGVPAIAATAVDGVRVRPGLYAIDTAHWTSRVAAARPSKPIPEGAAEAPLRLRGLEVGGRLYEQVPTRIEGSPGGRLAGEVGMAVWSRDEMRVNIQQRWLELTALRDAGL